MSNFTPGPWTAKENAYNYWGVYSPNETLLAEAPFKYRPANIRLMAAAPEMKDLLYKAHEKLADLNNNYELGDDNPIDLCFEIRKILHRIEGEEDHND